ncbi:MAG: DUF6324 family protein [Pikeienuella sp.]
MSINKETEQAADLQIGPTTLGMVRIYIETESSQIPMDFEPEEAEEIAEELRAAAAQARQATSKGSAKGSKGKR